MGRHLSSFYHPVLAVHAPSRASIEATDDVSFTESTASSTYPDPSIDSTMLREVVDMFNDIHAMDEMRDYPSTPLKWRDAPFDIDEERDDAVYEAFLASDGSPLPSPTAGQLGSSLPLSTPLDRDAPSPLDFSDCLDGPPLSPDDHFLHPNSQSQQPMTPSSGVFHTLTLPLTLPAPHERLGSRRASTTLPSSLSISTPTLSTSITSPMTAPTVGSRHEASTTSMTSPIQFSLPPAPRWIHRQPPTTTLSQNDNTTTSRPWEDEEGTFHWDTRRSLIQAEFASILEQLRSSTTRP